MKSSLIDPIMTSALIPHPQETLESHRLSGVFRGEEKQEKEQEKGKVTE